MIRSAAASSVPCAAAVASEVLRDGATAVDALIAGFLAASGEDRDVALSPLVILVAGAGAGARAFDGRSLQPGRGAPRPRGTVEGGTIPRAANVSVPRSLAALSFLHALHGKTSMAELARPGVQAAQNAESPGRAAFLRRFGTAGTLALREAVPALTAAAGPVAGGVLTESDVIEATPADAPALVVSLSPGTAFLPPWPVAEGASDVLVACDARGLLAAAAWAKSREGVVVASLELTLPMAGVPVRRHVTRVAPGTTLAAPAPIAIATIHGETPLDVVLALSGANAISAEGLAFLATEPLLEGALDKARHASTARSVLAVVRDVRGARPVSTA